LQQPRSQEETPCTSTQEVSLETLLNKGRKPSQILCYILQGKDLHHQENLAHKRVLANPRRLVPKRGVHLSQEDELAEISKLTLDISFLNGEFTFTYIRLDLSTQVSISTTDLTSLSHNIININQINYLLH
jgi:hypothetical protein